MNTTKKDPDRRVTVIRTGIDRDASQPVGGVIVAIADDGFWTTRDAGWRQLIAQASQQNPDTQPLDLIRGIAATRGDLFEIVEVS